MAAPYLVDILPAILPKNFAALQEGVGHMRGIAKCVQIDVVDGIFVKNKTWPYEGAASFERILAGDEGLPGWEDIDFQFDLMVEHPAHEAGRFIQAGGFGLVIHKISPGAREAMTELQAARDGDFAVKIGLAVMSSAALQELDEFAGLYDFVQVMGIEKFGFQGQPFDERAIALVKKIRDQYPDLLIQVDGGVSLGNIRTLVRAGANRLVCGSAVFGAVQPRAAYKALYTEANGTH